MNPDGDFEILLPSKAVPNFDPAFSFSPQILGGMESSYQAMGVIAYAAIKVRTRRMEMVRHRWMDDKANERKPDARLDALFERPNQIMTGSQLFGLMEGYRLTSGGYVLVKRCGGLPCIAGQYPDELLPFPLNAFRPRYARGLRDPYAVVGYDYSTGAGNVFFDLSSLVVWQDPDYSGAFSLVPALRQVLSASKMYAHVDSYMDSVLVNNARPGTVIVRKDAADEPHDDERRKMLAEFRAMHGGPRNAGKPLQLWGDYEVTALPLVSPKDVVSEDLWSQTVERVCMAFSVDPFLIGRSKVQNRATSDTIVANFVTSTCAGMMVDHQAAIRFGLLQPLGIPYRLEFDITSLPEYASVTATRLANIQIMIETGTPRNEAYRKMGVPVEDQPWGERSLLKVGLENADDVVAGVPSVAPAKPAREDGAPVPPVHGSPSKETDPQEGDQGRDDAGDGDAAPEKRVRPRMKVSDRVKALGVKKRREIMAKCWAKCVEPFEPAMNAKTATWARRWKGHFTKRLNHFLATGQHLDENSPLAKNASHVFEPFAVSSVVLLDVEIDGVRQTVESKSFRWKGDSDPSIPTDDDLRRMMPGQGDSVADLKMGWRVSFSDVEAATVEHMKDELGSIDAFLSLPPEQHRQIAVDRMGDAIKCDSTIRDQLSAMLQREASSDPMPGPVQMAEALRTESNHVFAKAVTRANSIARTELGGVLSDYRHAVKTAEGHDTHAWSSAGDACVRASHRLCEAEGEIPIGQKFSNGLSRPHDPKSDDAGELVNCRCGEI